MPRLWLALLGVVVLATCGMSVILLLRMSPPPQAPVPPPPPPQLLDHYEALLPGGVRVELVGLALMETDPPRWWKPDGSPLLSKPTLESTQQGLMYQVGSDMRRVQIFIHGLDDYTRFTANMMGIKAVQKLPSGESGVSYSGGLVVLNGQSESEVRIGVATEPLSPTRVLNPQGLRVPAAVDAPPDPILEDIVVTQVESDSGVGASQVQTKMTFITPICWRQTDLKMVAIDLTGRTHQIAGSGGNLTSDAHSKSQGMATGEFYFPLPPTQIDRFEYQFRLYRYWVTFENVSVHPDRITQVKVSIDPDPSENLRGGIDPVSF